MDVLSEVKVAQPCPTLCDPMAYTVHGILQARIPEWVTVPFSKGPSRVQLFVTPWTVAQQALLSMEFSRQEYWRGVAISYLFPCPVLMKLKVTATYILGNTLLLVLISILERFHYNIFSYQMFPRSQ